MGNHEGAQFIPLVKGRGSVLVVQVSLGLFVKNIETKVFVVRGKNIIYFYMNKFFLQEMNSINSNISGPAEVAAKVDVKVRYRQTQVPAL